MEFLKRVNKKAATIERLRERARLDGSPRGYVELCRALVLQGRAVRALAVAQEGVRRFPRSLELADQLRLVWGQASRGDLQELERKAKETRSADSFRALADHYLNVAELDLALECAQQLYANHPDLVDGPVLVGRALSRRFFRDHVGSDGTRALDVLRRAVALNPRSFEAQHLLAELCFYVGSVKNALEAAAAALAIEPDDRDVAALHSVLLQLPAEVAGEAELIRASEESDGPWRGYRPPESRTQSPEPAIAGNVARMLHQISLMAGVRSVAFSRDGVEFVARDGNVFPEKRAVPDRLVVLTKTFRRRIAASTKRLGIGAFQEAEIALKSAVVMAFGGMNAVVMVEVEPGTRSSAIVSGCRDLMGSLDRTPGEPAHA